MMIGRSPAPSGGFIPPGAAFDDTSCIRYRPTPGTIQNARGRAHSLVMRVDAAAIGRNLDVLAEVKRRAGCRILLALKAFSMFSVFPLMLA